MNPTGAQVKQKNHSKWAAYNWREDKTLLLSSSDQDSRAHSHPNPSPVRMLVLFFTNLLPVTLASERFFNALLLAWFQIEGVALDLFDDVFGLHFALEAAQCVFERLAFLNANLCQGKYTSQSGLIGYHPE
jgi:hypothetical protein